MGNADVEIKEINHFAVGKAIDEITHGAAKNQGKSVGEKSIFPGGPMVKPDQKEGHQCGKKKKYKLSDAGGLLCEKAKGPPGIQHVIDVEKPGDDLNVIIQGNVSRNPEFGHLVDKADNPADQNETYPFP